MIYISFLHVYWTLLFGLYEFPIAESVRGLEAIHVKGNSFPFIVSIGNLDSRNSPEKNHFCGGSLITKKLVLTAAHCLNKKNLNRVQVLAGSFDLSLCKKYKPIWWQTFNEWRAILLNRDEKLSNGADDIAIIKLSQEVDILEKDLAVLSEKQNDELYGTIGTIVGWGRQLDNTKPRIMQQAFVEILNKEDCKRTMQVVDERIICSFSEGFSFLLLGCGDSGGPLLDDDKTILAVNRAVCPWYEENTVKINTHVGIARYLDFINDVKKMENVD